MDELKQLLHPQLLILGGAFVIVIQAVINAMTRDPDTWTPPVWAKVAATFVISFLLGMGYRAMIPIDGGTTPSIAQLWWVQWLLLWGYMVLVHTTLNATYGKNP